SVCGEKIGLFGNRKLEDGNLCKSCASRLSPWFSDRKSSTVAEIREQLAYREANKEKVAAFDPTRTLGRDTKVMFDDGARKLIVSSASNWKNDNPDVIDYSDLTGASVDISEGREEITTKNAEGKFVSCDPPRYKARYDIYVNINVDNPWFSSMRFRVNPSTVVIDPVVSGPGMAPLRPGASMNNLPPAHRMGSVTVSKADPNTDPKYVEYMKAAEEIKDAVLQKVNETVSAAAPKAAVKCPYCGATTVPDKDGRCEYCGAPVGD
ncbi:MAG: DUF4428 domain-containing protein, partial [Firmicutes bacterium]|nr:DUF4428 domain-containing protein [Bacillota bacterium]